MARAEGRLSGEGLRRLWIPLIKRRGKFRFLISRLKAAARLIGDSALAITCMIEVPNAYRSIASGLAEFRDCLGGMYPGVAPQGGSVSSSLQAPSKSSARNL